VSRQNSLLEFLNPLKIEGVFFGDFELFFLYFNRKLSTRWVWLGSAKIFFFLCLQTNIFLYSEFFWMNFFFCKKIEKIGKMGITRPFLDYRLLDFGQPHLAHRGPEHCWKTPYRQSGYHSNSISSLRWNTFNFSKNLYFGRD